MKYIPPYAILVALAIIYSVGLYLAHWISNQAHDAHLQFLQSLVRRIPSPEGTEKTTLVRGSLGGASEEARS